MQEEKSKTLKEFMDISLTKTWKELGAPLPTGQDPTSIARLKECAVYAESLSGQVAVWKRQASIHLDELHAELAKEYRKQAKSSGEKTSIAGEERYINERSIRERALEKELTDMQEVIKRRVLLAQTMLRSVSTESGTFTQEIRDIRLN